MKKLIKSFAVVALIVPFLFGFAACDKDDISAKTAYNQILKTVGAQQPDKLTYVITSSSFESGLPTTNSKIVFGYDNSLTNAENYFVLQYENNILQNEEFTQGTGEEKKVYKSEYKPQETSATDKHTYTSENYTNQFAAAFDKYVTNMDSYLDGALSTFLPATSDTSFSLYKTMVEVSMSNYTKTKYEGEKFKDGSYALEIDFSAEDSVLGEEGDAEVIIKVKGGKLISMFLEFEQKINDRVVNRSAYSIQFTYNYLTSYLPKNLNNWKA